MHVKTIVTHNKNNIDEKQIAKILNHTDLNTHYYQIPQDKLFDENGYLKLTAGSIDNVLDKMLTGSKRLGEICEVNNGIHTQADYLSNQKFKFRNNKDKKINDGIYSLSKENPEDIRVSTS